ncbi:3-phosphoinositide-dependent protein kinase 1 [Plakobranchus ocellatus]|uniref:3-phosphoinositide-dependent protein kinase 1 n=1 Tax=Plakobranchus ocellatus TaxID=259542 RepID=A0AAV4CMM4_9GAST|nr:3-phosphoinositide-dependent protein kinase 1 [Plakobranchus ocellatus]
MDEPVGVITVAMDEPEPIKPLEQIPVAIDEPVPVIHQEPIAAAVEGTDSGAPGESVSAVMKGVASTVVLEEQMPVLLHKQGEPQTELNPTSCSGDIAVQQPGIGSDASETHGNNPTHSAQFDHDLKPDHNNVELSCDGSSPTDHNAQNQMCPAGTEGYSGSILSEETISKDSSDVQNVHEHITMGVSGASLPSTLDPQQNQALDMDLPGVFVPDHFGNDDSHIHSVQSLSEGSSDSEDDQRIADLDDDYKDMEFTQLDSDVGSSSISPRDRASSEMSTEDTLAGLESLRQCAGSVVSNVSSYSWMREGTMGSTISVDPDSALGRIRADMAALVSGDGAGNAAAGQPKTVPDGQVGDASAKTQSAELINELEAGPTVILPPSEPQSSKPGTESVPDEAALESSTAAELSISKNQPSQPETDLNCSGMDSKSQKSASVSSDSSFLPGTSSSQTTDAPAESKPIKASTSAEAGKPRVKKSPNDFIFGKVIGEGSYSTVYLAKEVSSQKEFAIKICEKKHLIRERKTHFVMREKEVFMKLDHPFFVKLAYTFQDSERLYYVLTYARNGELLSYLHKLSVFDVPCTRFYTAEVTLALEYLHSLGIIHRDLKPENILLSEDMHIKITDFGTSKVLPLGEDGKPVASSEIRRKNSFVGTAEYVSPEVLNNEPANFGSDLWALGCIIYQCLSGSMPFRAGNEYQTFQKIVRLEYSFPEGFNKDAKDLVSQLLVLDPEDRLGMPKTGGMSALKAHRFYAGLDWADLPNTTPPKLMPYLPATSHNPEFWGHDNRVGFDDQRLAEIITGQSTTDGSLSPELEEVPIRGSSPIDGTDGKDEAASREDKLEKQRRENQFHKYVQGNLILKQGFVDKRKGLFARKRMLLLTEGPHLYYVDAHHKVLKGEIPWSRYLRPEAKNFKIFFVHTPNRTYYLESRLPDAQMWVKKIKEVWRRYYGSSQDEKS